MAKRSASTLVHSKRLASKGRGHSPRLLAALNRRLRLEPLEDRRLLATFTVTDLSLDAGPGSLRQAILDANAGGDPVDDIVFQAGLSGTVTLTSGEIPITGSLNITGPGAEVITVSGNDSSRIFNIDDSNAGNLLDVQIDGLTLTSGSITGSGGAILSQENLTLRNSIVSGSSAMGSGGGVAASAGVTTIENSTLDGNTATGATAQGGAIASDAEIVVTNSTLSNNRVVGMTDGVMSIDIGGGAIRGGGDIMVAGSTINNNEVEFFGQTTTGSLTAKGAGVSGSGSQVSIFSSTIRENGLRFGLYGEVSTASSVEVQGGAVQSDASDVTIAGSTIRDNFADLSRLTASAGAISVEGGGVSTASGNVSVMNSVVSGNIFFAAIVNAATDLSLEGGGIRSESGTINLTSSVVSGNRISPYRNTVGGDLNVRGGGVSGGGNITVTRSEINENYLAQSDGSGGSVTGTTRVQGGGVWGGDGVVAIDGATISGNTIASGSGALGGGVHLESGPGSLTITSSTISGNTTVGSGGAISHQGGALSVSYSTIAFNTADTDAAGGEDGGGILVGVGAGAPLLQHTIVAQNLLDTASDDVAGTFDAASRFNLIGNGDGSVGLVNVVNGNQVGSMGAEVDPLLEPLKNNGGPLATHALLAGSPAIDAGDPVFAGPPNADQRLLPFARVADGGTALRIDVGAYERQTLSVGPLVVTTADDELDAGFNAGDLSLREAISIANGSLGADTITFDTAGVFSTPQTIAMAPGLGEMPITDSLTITGPGAEVVTIDAQAGSRIFNADDGSQAILSDVEITGLTLTGGDTTNASGPSSGGAIRVLENFTLRDAVLTGNTAGSGGGALYSGVEAFAPGSSAMVTVERSVFSNNVTTNSGGGAIRFDGGALGDNSMVTINVSDVVATGNTADGDGGGINFRADNGGANSTVTKTLRNLTVTGNTAGNSGGGVSDDSDTTGPTGNGTNTLIIEDSDISGNVAESDGGGIDLDMEPFNPNSDWSVFITRVSITGNTAGAGNFGGDGGGFFNDNDTSDPDTSNTITIADSTISGNTALGGSSSFAGRGGGVFSEVEADDVNGVQALVIHSTSIFNNSAEGRGGGAFFETDPSGIEPTASATTTVINSAIHGNTSVDRGGGIYADTRGIGTLTISNTTISGNNTTGAAANGGGIYSVNDRGGSLTINSSTITNNGSGGTGVGGGLYNLSDGLDGGGASGVTLVHNTIVAANMSGGGTDPDFSTASANSGIASIDARFSLIGDVGTATVTDLVGNQIGTTGSPINPMLGPLANNGGSTLTHALQPGSPAIDMGGGTPIAGLLFNTGVDSQGNVLGDSVDDPHYTIFSQPAGGNLTDETIPADGFPIPPWLPNEADSRWIGPATIDAQGPAGEYVYRTTFDLSGLDFANSTFTITGRWASDNAGTDILINGVSTGQTNGEFTAFSSFSIDTGFVSGLNTLDFVVQNALGIESPTGLIVDDIQLVASRAYDQRGFAFARVVGGTIDIGAFESSAVSADFDLDGDVDGSDFLTWQRGFGTTPNATHSQGDADVDATVDAADLAIWQLQYGSTPLATSAPLLGYLAATIDSSQSTGQTVVLAERPTDAELIDAVMAWLWSDNQKEEKGIFPVDSTVSEAAIWTDLATKENTSPSGKKEELATTRTAIDSAPENGGYEEWLSEDVLDWVFG